MKHTATRGYFLLFVLVAASLLLFLLSELIDSFAVEKNAELLGSDQEQALSAAEAGVAYYEWHLAHFPGDQSDTPTHTLLDPETASTTGAFSLQFFGQSACGVLTSVRVDSTGYGTSTPNHARTVSATLMKPTFAASTTPATSNASRVAADLVTLKNYALASGTYLAPSGGKGYKLVFNANGTVSVTVVTDTETVWGFSNEDGWVQEKSVIAGTGMMLTRTISANCPVVYADDPVWVEGTVSGLVTLGAASTTPADIILTGNILPAQTGDGLAVVAQRSVLISPQSPDVMTIHGIFVSGSGHTGRNRYDSSGTHAAPADVAPSITRSTLNTYGTLVSDGTMTTKWSSGGVFISGYASENDYHDSMLGTNPPPFTPETGDYFRAVDWRLKI